MTLYFTVRVEIDHMLLPAWLNVQRTAHNEQAKFEELIVKQIEWNLQQQRGLKTDAYAQMAGNERTSRG
jgi:hypothetical protein